MSSAAFPTRRRLLAHLCDSHRDKCWQQMSALSSRYLALSESTGGALDEKDRGERRGAAKCWHSLPLACAHSIAARGNLVGHVGS